MTVDEFFEMVRHKKWFEVDSTNERMVARLVRERRVEFIGERVVCYGPRNTLRRRVTMARVKAQLR